MKVLKSPIQIQVLPSKWLSGHGVEAEGKVETEMRKDREHRV